MKKTTVNLNCVRFVSHRPVDSDRNWSLVKT